MTEPIPELPGQLTIYDELQEPPMSPTESLARRIEAVVRAAKAIEAAPGDYLIHRELIRNAEHALVEAVALGEAQGKEAGDE